MSMMQGGGSQSFQDDGYGEGLNQDLDQGSSFYSQAFKQQLITTKLQSGFDPEDCKLNDKVLQLQQLLHQEKSSPELLPYQHFLIG